MTFMGLNTATNRRPEEKKNERRKKTHTHRAGGGDKERRTETGVFQWYWKFHRMSFDCILDWVGTKWELGSVH